MPQILPCYALNIAYYAGNNNKLAEPIEELYFCWAIANYASMLAYYAFGNVSARP